MTVYVDLESDTDHLSISSPQASQREDSYEETIRDLTQRLKDVSILLFAWCFFCFRFFDDCLKIVFAYVLKLCLLNAWSKLTQKCVQFCLSWWCSRQLVVAFAQLVYVDDVITVTPLSGFCFMRFANPLFLHFSLSLLFGFLPLPFLLYMPLLLSLLTLSLTLFPPPPHHPLVSSLSQYRVLWAQFAAPKYIHEFVPGYT